MKNFDFEMVARTHEDYSNSKNKTRFEFGERQKHLNSK